MEPLNIKYNVFIKNKTRKSATWVLRIKQDGQVKDQPLHTQDPSVAKKTLEKAKLALTNYNYAVEDGNATEAMLDQVIRINSETAKEKTGNTGTSIREALDAWEIHQRRAGAREATISTYGRALERILDQGAPLRSAIDTDAILARCDHVASATRHLYMAALGSFREFLSARYQINYQVGEIPKIKVDPVKTQTQWSIFQMRRIIDAVRITVKAKMMPDEAATEDFKTYLWLLATSGLRQGEAYALRWGDIDWKHGAVNLRKETTKARQARTAPLQDYVLERLARMEKRLAKPSPADPIFSTIPKSQPGRFEVLVRAINEANEELKKLNGEPIPHGGLHTFRHSCACILYAPDDEGRLPDVKAVAAILGHSPAVTLQYYIRGRDIEENKNIVNSKFTAVDGMRGAIDDVLHLI